MNAGVHYNFLLRVCQYQLTNALSAWKWRVYIR